MDLKSVLQTLAMPIYMVEPKRKSISKQAQSLDQNLRAKDYSL
jgi:hypothetical protein